MPVTNLAGLQRMAAMSGVGVPAWLARMFKGTEDDPELRRMIAAVVTAEQVRLLQANGVDEFHFYTLNRPELTHAIAHILGVRGRKGGWARGTGRGSGRKERKEGKYAPSP